MRAPAYGLTTGKPPTRILPNSALPSNQKCQIGRLQKIATVLADDSRTKAQPIKFFLHAVRMVALNFDRAICNGSAGCTGAF